MIVVIANDIPDIVRGHLKLWFIEVKPYVFVSGVKNHVAKKVIEFLIENSPPNSGMLIFESVNKPPFYNIITKGKSHRKIKNLNGIQVLLE